MADLNLPTPNKDPGDGAPADDINLVIEAVNTLNSAVENIAAGPQGPQGEPGTPGADGEAATVSVAATVTTAAGADAQVVEGGTPQNRTLTFYIPRGEQGPTGAQGDTGAQGPAGDPGTPAAVSIGTVTTGAAGSNATVTNSGTTENVVLDFSIPQGETGPAANLGSATPQDLGTAAAGSSAFGSREDHVHNMPSASDVGADPSGTAASAVSTHNADTTSVHGIADTSLLATTAYVDTAESDAVTAANSYSDSLASNYDSAGSAAAVASDLSDHELATTTVHGIADTSALVVTTDSRLSDARTPTAHAASHESGGSDALTLAPAQITGTAVVDSDARLTDARTPLSHAATHTAGGSDEITVAQSQVTNLTSDLSAKAPLASPTFTGTPAAPTATQGTNTTQLATTAYVQTELANVDALPDQTGNAGSYLTTDGSTASWAEITTDPTPSIFFLGGM